jgi:hypothetical protein
MEMGQQPGSLFRVLSAVTLLLCWLATLLLAIFGYAPWPRYVVGLLGFPVALLARYLIASTFWKRED